MKNLNDLTDWQDVVRVQQLATQMKRLISDYRHTSRHLSIDIVQDVECIFFAIDLMYKQCDRITLDMANDNHEPTNKFNNK